MCIRQVKGHINPLSTPKLKLCKESDEINRFLQEMFPCVTIFVVAFFFAPSTVDVVVFHSCI